MGVSCPSSRRVMTPLRVDTKALISLGVSGLYPVLWAMSKHMFMQRLFRGPKSCTRIAPFKAYADILPDHRKALDSIDAILEELEEHRSMLENLLEE
ncbi:MAG: hypothetical protein ACPLRJ_03805 [Infirmifilum uzonense]|uniref:hypothetical protein n=3 Tax=Infirmifilum TaxID=2856573 RepID=UPI003C75AA86